jgi:hypothetical protein
VLLSSAQLPAADWTRFRGPGGLGISEEKGVPTKWSATENIAWKVDLPGPGASSPITSGQRVFLTCYSGYGLEAGQGDQQDLVRHLLCLDRKSGEIVWHKEFKPKLPEHKYQGEGAYHGYAASTPTVEGNRLYVFFGKSGVFCFDLDGKEIWQAEVGDGINGWGSGTSPLIYGNSLIINASVESRSLVGLNKKTGEEIWRAGGISSAWNTPLLVETPKAETELVVSIQGRVLGFDPNNGKPLWNAHGVERYVCPSVVAHKTVVYALGGGHTSLAVRTGGRDDVTETLGLWRKSEGSNVSSPIYYQGHLYWTPDGGTVCCQDAKTGEFVYKERLKPSADRIWSSPVLADGKLYYVSQHNGTFVVAAKPEFELLAHNQFEDDDSRTNASPAVSNGQLFLRTDRRLYCVGQQ